MNKEIIDNKWKEFLDVKHDLRENCLTYIKDFLKENNTDKYLIEDNVDIDEFNEQNGYPSIEYDGGKHPEYATNVYSHFYGVGIRLGRVYFIIEDSDEYYAERVWSVEELSNIVDWLEWCRTHKKKEE